MVLNCVFFGDAEAITPLLLFISLSPYSSLPLSVYLSYLLSTLLTTFFSVHPVVCPACLSVSLSVCLYVNLSVCLSPCPVCLSICQSACLSVCLSVCLLVLRVYTSLSVSLTDSLIQSHSPLPTASYSSCIYFFLFFSNYLTELTQGPPSSYIIRHMLQIFPIFMTDIRKYISEIVKMKYK